MTVLKFIRFRPSEGVLEVPSARMMGGIAAEVFTRVPFDGFKDVPPSDEYKCIDATIMERSWVNCTWSSLAVGRLFHHG